MKLAPEGVHSQDTKGGPSWEPHQKSDTTHSCRLERERAGSSTKNKMEGTFYKILVMSMSGQNQCGHCTCLDTQQKS